VPVGVRASREPADPAAVFGIPDTGDERVADEADPAVGVRHHLGSLAVAPSEVTVIRPLRTPAQVCHPRLMAHADAAVVMERGAPGAPVVTLLPGRGYGPDAPLLYYARELLRSRGWAVRTVHWERVPNLDPTDHAAVAAVAGETLGGSDPARDLVVAKSLGSLALPAAAERGVPGIWLTPLLGIEDVRRAAARAAATTLLIGGTADPYWDGAAARATGAAVFEVPGADHSLERPGDLDGTLAVLATVLSRIAVQLDALAVRGA
jgi:hypothetical protein